jgi:erythritol kinase
VLDRAASAFAAKDCVYFFCTGARASDAATAAAAFGDWRTGAYGTRVLGMLELEAVERLLPEIVDGAREHGELTPAAAAATGLMAGTPVVLAPLDTVAAALALGLGGRDAEIGGTLLGATYLHMRVCADLETAESIAGQATMLPFAPAGCWLGVLQHSGMANVDWLVGSAEQLLLDAGLIGLPHEELGAMLERRAAEAAPGGVSCRPFAGEDGAEFRGLSAHTTFYDLLRGVYEGVARAARDGYAALDFRPRQVRVDGAGPAGPLAHQCLAACLDAPVLAIDGAAPAAGAALVAAVSLGQYRDAAEASRAWIEPRLREVQASAHKREARITPAPT